MFNIIKKNYFLLISTFLILYFIFNLLDGERGLFSYMKKKELLKNLKQTEINYINKINNLTGWSPTLSLSDILGRVVTHMKTI